MPNRRRRFESEGQRDPVLGLGLAALDPKQPATVVDARQVRAIVRDLYSDSGMSGADAVWAAHAEAGFLRRRHDRDLNLAAAEQLLLLCGETEGRGPGGLLQLLPRGPRGASALMEILDAIEAAGADDSVAPPPTWRAPRPNADLDEVG